MDYKIFKSLVSIIKKEHLFEIEKRSDIHSFIVLCNLQIAILFYDKRYPFMYNKGFAY